MKRKIFTTALALSAMILLQNCKKDTVDPVIPEEDHTHWDYENTDWTAFSADCKGIIQSPIDIDTNNTLKVSLPDLALSYSEFPISIIDNGHTVQVNTNTYNTANTVVFNNKTYKLKQFHFHSQSEHKIAGVRSAMEVHFVHATDGGELLVIGVMIEEGTPLPGIDNVWNNWPADKEKEVATSAMINISDMMPTNKKYYNYIGSLTTPPCSMGLVWIVMKAPIQVSASQMARFNERYNHNYRPTQPLNNRVVYEQI